MAAPKGNEFWKMAKNIGKPKRFSDPDELWDSACGYFQWCVDNPLEKAIVYQGEVSTTTEKLNRPFTIDGLCVHIGIDDATLNTYEKSDSHKEYNAVTKMIKSIMREQKFAGATVGLFNPNIIARDLGLADNQNIESPKGTMSPTGYTPEQYAAAEIKLKESMDGLD